MDTRVWRKSSRSGGNNGDCVELAAAADGLSAAIRDSKNPDGERLELPWRTLVAAAKSGHLPR